MNAFDPETGLLVDSTYYEGGRWNYSFRILHDMQARIELAGGDERFLALLDSFFGYGADPVKQVGERPSVEELAAGYALNRFEGLNNEPDMEVPWAYHYVGRPDRTAEVVHAAMQQQFGLGRGGLPGNDDSGGLSSWYVWASLGLFPVAGQSLYLINAPSFAHVPDPASAAPSWRSTTEGFVEPEPDGPAQYVQSVTLQRRAAGAELADRPRAAPRRHAAIRLGPKPSDWGTTTDRRRSPGRIGLSEELGGRAAGQHRRLTGAPPRRLSTDRLDSERNRHGSLDRPPARPTPDRRAAGWSSWSAPTR